jgi:hypothetical protein
VFSFFLPELPYHPTPQRGITNLLLITAGHIIQHLRRRGAPRHERMEPVTSQPWHTWGLECGSFAFTSRFFFDIIPPKNKRRLRLQTHPLQRTSQAISAEEKKDRSNLTGVFEKFVLIFWLINLVSSVGEPEMSIGSEAG